MNFESILLKDKQSSEQLELLFWPHVPESLRTTPGRQLAQLLLVSDMLSYLTRLPLTSRNELHHSALPVKEIRCLLHRNPRITNAECDLAVITFHICSLLDHSGCKGNPKLQSTSHNSIQESELRRKLDFRFRSEQCVSKKCVDYDLCFPPRPARIEIRIAIFGKHLTRKKREARRKKKDKGRKKK